jgi:hypothetical protein
MQRARLERPAVRRTEAGALRLGSLYWDTVERTTARLVRARSHASGVELQLLGRGPALLSFDPPELQAGPGRVSCRYEISGGLLARSPGGELMLSQVGGDTPEVSSRTTGFYPRLGSRPGRPEWTGVLYRRVQSRIHVAISHRFFDRLSAESRG